MITTWKRQAIDGMPSLFENTPNKPTFSVEQRDQIEVPLFQQIEQLKLSRRSGRERLLQKKITDGLSTDLRTLTDPNHGYLSISQQCSLLGLARSTYY